MQIPADGVQRDLPIADVMLYGKSLLMGRDKEKRDP